jgi:C-terminal processing protease CtpA/Prc
VNPPKLIATFLLLLPLTALPASPQSASEIGQAVAEDALAMVQDQLEAAQAQASEAAEKAEKSLGKGIEEARKKASQQMEAARKQMEEARRQWQKQIEEARKQMQEAANSIRAAAREERLASVYPRLGIVVRPNAGGDGTSASAGAVVQGVTPGSPAEKAGIKAGDVITAVDGHLVQTPVDAPKGDDATSHIVRLLRKTRAGQQIEVEYRRGSENRKAEIQVESRRGSWSNAFHDDRRSVRSAELPGGWSEVELAAISSELGEYFGTSRGLLVLHSSGSGEVKLKPGDVILKIGDEEPSTPTQAVRLLRSYEPGQAIPVEVLRQKQKQVLSLQMPRAGVEKH